MELTVEENLVIYGRYFDLSYREARERAKELLDFVQLTERAKDQVEPLSGGMKRRLVIARGLINQPDLLLLDEPTTGLDPQARHLLWDRLYRLKQQGVSLILTTHYMDEAEQLCDRLVVMDKAQIVAEGSPRALIDAVRHREVLELRFRPGGPGHLDGRLDGLAERIETLPDRLLLYTADGDAAAVAVHERGLRPGAGAGPPEHPRGRVPAAHRPHRSSSDRRDRRSCPARSTCWSTSCWCIRRTWRGGVFTTFLAPVLFLAAMGLGLGTFVDEADSAAHGGRRLPRVPGARTAGLAGDADRRGRVDVSHHVRHHLEPDVPVDDLGTPSRALHVVLGTALWFDRPADARVRGVRGGHRSCSAPSDILRGIAMMPGGGADGARVRAADHRHSRRPSERRQAASRPSTASSSRPCSCSAACSSPSTSCRRSCSPSRS